MPDTRHDWPTFKAPLLEAVAAAFTKRRNAIRHRTESFEIEREAEDSGFEPPERLNVNGATIASRPVQLRLSVWPDGALWFWAGRATKQGWQFQVSFNGFLGEAAPTSLVSKFEKSIRLLYSATSASECKEPLVSLWRDVEPRIERAVYQSVKPDVE